MIGCGVLARRKACREQIIRLQRDKDLCHFRLPLAFIIKHYLAYRWPIGGADVSYCDRKYRVFTGIHGGGYRLDELEFLLTSASAYRMLDMLVVPTTIGKHFKCDKYF